MVDQAEIEPALHREIAIRELPTEESGVWMERFAELTDKRGLKEETFFAGRRRAGEGLGLDAGSYLVHAKPDCPDARLEILL